MLELLMSEWEDHLENEEYEPVHDVLRAGVKLLEKYYCRADDTDVYFIAHGRGGHFNFNFNLLYFTQSLILCSNLTTSMPLGTRSTWRLV